MANPITAHYLGNQCHGTPEDLALMATIKCCDCGNDVVTILEACVVRCNRDECGEYWDGLNYEEAIQRWNEEMRNSEPAAEIIGGFF